MLENISLNPFPYYLKFYLLLLILLLYSIFWNTSTLTRCNILSWQVVYLELKKPEVERKEGPGANVPAARIRALRIHLSPPSLFAVIAFSILVPFISSLAFQGPLNVLGNFKSISMSLFCVMERRLSLNLTPWFCIT